MTTFKCRWKNWQCIPACVCGWESGPVQTVKQAKILHNLHVLEDCPIGTRKAT